MLLKPWLTGRSTQLTYPLSPAAVPAPASPPPVPVPVPSPPAQPLPIYSPSPSPSPDPGSYAPPPRQAPMPEVTPTPTPIPTPTPTPTPTPAPAPTRSTPRPDDITTNPVARPTPGQPQQATTTTTTPAALQPPSPRYTLPPNCRPAPCDMYIPGFNDEQHRAQVFMCDRLPDIAAPLTAVEGVCRPQATPPVTQLASPPGQAGYARHAGYGGQPTRGSSRRLMQDAVETDDLAEAAAAAVPKNDVLPVPGPPLNMSPA